MKERIFYGDRDDGTRTTIHSTEHIDVETHEGTVVAVWFRCLRLPFQQREADLPRALDVAIPENDVAIRGIAFEVER